MNLNLEIDRIFEGRNPRSQMEALEFLDLGILITCRLVVQRSTVRPICFSDVWCETLDVGDVTPYGRRVYVNRAYPGSRDTTVRVRSMHRSLKRQLRNLLALEFPEFDEWRGWMQS